MSEECPMSKCKHAKSADDSRIHLITESDMKGWKNKTYSRTVVDQDEINSQQTQVVYSYESVAPTG